MAQLKALLIKKVSDKLHIFGPLTAVEAQQINDADLVLLLAHYMDLQTVDKQEEVEQFRNCTKNSKLLELAYSSTDSVKTIGYMLGSVLSEEVKDTELLLFNGVEFHEGS